MASSKFAWVVVGVTLWSCTGGSSPKSHPPKKSSTKAAQTPSVDASPPRDAEPLDAESAKESGFDIDKRGAFFGKPDFPIRHKLATEPVVDVERGYGGRSVAFKITLQDGTKGYYKPEQTFSAAHWYGELAAYYLDRELGFGRVAPAVGRRLPWKRLRQCAPSDERFEEVVVQPDGEVRGAFVWWIPEKLVPIRPGHRWERWLRVGNVWPARAVSPFQRPRVYMDLLENREGRKIDSERWGAHLDGGVGMPPQIGGDVGHAALAEETGHPAGAPDTPDRPAELSDMILFDYLTLNLDRWGGDYANVRTRESGGPLLFFDNAAGFTPGQSRNGVMLSRLHAVQRFRRTTVEALRAFDMTSFRKRLTSDPLAPILTDQALIDLETRRQDALDHVRAMEEKFGVDAVYF